MSDNVLSEFLRQEASACKEWINHSDRLSFEKFYANVLISLRKIGVPTLEIKSFYAIPLEKRLEELDRLEKEHRVELEAAFISVWLSHEMKAARDSYRKRAAIKLLQNM